MLQARVTNIDAIVCASDGVDFEPVPEGAEHGGNGLSEVGEVTQARLPSGGRGRAA